MAENEKTLLFEGGYTSVQNLLKSIKYTPPPDWNGADMVYISVDDGAANGNENVTSQIIMYIDVKSIADPPVLKCPSNTVHVVMEDSTANVIGDCEIICPEHINSVHELEISAEHGVTSLPSRSVDTLQMQRSLVKNISYTPENNYCGEDVIVLKYFSVPL